MIIYNINWFFKTKCGTYQEYLNQRLGLSYNDNLKSKNKIEVIEILNYLVKVNLNYLVHLAKV